jgi:two-component system chemotaxis response regulator CheB
MVHRDIVVIGGSAGAIEALQRIVRALDNHFSAAIFIVIHTAPGSSGFLPRILQRATVLPSAHPGDGDAIVGGRIHVAPPGHHLLVDRGVVRITKGPKENGFRPAVDPLFRTAVEAYGSRVIGVILSGGQDDGTFGLAMIKSAGGLAIVQHPLDALVSSMPESALQYVVVDHVVNADEIPSLLMEHASRFIEGGKAGREREKPDIAEVGADVLSSGADEFGPPSERRCSDNRRKVWSRHENVTVERVAERARRAGKD